MSDGAKKLVTAALGADRMSDAEKTLFGKMLFTYGWRVSAFAFALWACGAFDRFGLGGGFAYAETTETAQTNVEKRLTAIERKLLEQDIMTTLKESCAAPSKDYFRSRLNELQADYSAKTGSYLNLPSCAALGINGDGG